MKPKDVLLRVRRSFIDDYPWNHSTINWLTNDTGRLWKNYELVKAFEEARLEFRCRVPSRDSTTASIVQVPILLGQNPSITYDNSILGIKWVRLLSEDRNLNKFYINNQLEDLRPDWRINTDSPPENYVEDLDDYSLTLIGNLAANDTIEMSVDSVTLTPVEWPIDEFWLASTVYALDDFLRPTDQSGNDHWYKATTAGTSGATEPVAWVQDGTTVADGSVVWTDQGILGDYEITDIQDKHEQDLIHWMAHLLYMKRDPDMGDSAGSAFGTNLSLFHGRMFTDRVGPRRSAQTQKQSRRISNLKRRTRSVY